MATKEFIRNFYQHFEVVENQDATYEPTQHEYYTLYSRVVKITHPHRAAGEYLVQMFMGDDVGSYMGELGPFGSKSEATRISETVNGASFPVYTVDGPYEFDYFDNLGEYVETDGELEEEEYQENEAQNGKTRSE